MTLEETTKFRHSAEFRKDMEAAAQKKSKELGAPVTYTALIRMYCEQGMARDKGKK